MRLSSPNASRIFFLLVSLLCCARAAAPRPLHSPAHRVSGRRRKEELAAGPAQVTSSTSPDFAIQVSPTTLSVSNTAEGDGVVTLTGAGGFIGTVDLSCDISPIAAFDAPICLVFGNQVNVDSTSSPTMVPFVVIPVSPSCMDIYAKGAPGTFGGDSRQLVEIEGGLIALALLICSAQLFLVKHRTKVWRSAI